MEGAVDGRAFRRPHTTEMESALTVRPGWSILRPLQFIGKIDSRTRSVTPRARTPPGRSRPSAVRAVGRSLATGADPNAGHGRSCPAPSRRSWRPPYCLRRPDRRSPRAPSMPSLGLGRFSSKAKAVARPPCSKRPCRAPRPKCGQSFWKASASPIRSRSDRRNRTATRLRLACSGNTSPSSIRTRRNVHKPKCRPDRAAPRPARRTMCLRTSRQSGSHPR